MKDFSENEILKLFQVYLNYNLKILILIFQYLYDDKFIRRDDG